MNELLFDCAFSYPNGASYRVTFHSQERSTALFGPSGCGKTTTLEILAGTIVPSSGMIRLGERVLFDSERGICVPARERRIGAAFQDLLLFPHMTVEKNLLYARRWKKSSKTICYKEVVDVLELGGLLNRYPARLSGGEKQRVALGRALLSEPECLVMDEPLSALDEALKMRIMQYLSYAIEKWNITTVFASHSRDEVCGLAEHLVSLEGSRVVGETTPDEFFHGPAALNVNSNVIFLNPEITRIA